MGSSPALPDIIRQLLVQVKVSAIIKASSAILILIMVAQRYLTKGRGVLDKLATTAENTAHKSPTDGTPHVYEDSDTDEHLRPGDDFLPTTINGTVLHMASTQQRDN